MKSINHVAASTSSDIAAPLSLRRAKKSDPPLFAKIGTSSQKTLAIARLPQVGEAIFESLGCEVHVVVPRNLRLYPLAKGRRYLVFCDHDQSFTIGAKLLKIKADADRIPLKLIPKDWVAQYERKGLSAIRDALSLGGAA